MFLLAFLSLTAVTASLGVVATRSQLRLRTGRRREQLVSLETSRELAAILRRRQRERADNRRKKRLELSRSSYLYALQGDPEAIRYYFPENFPEEQED